MSDHSEVILVSPSLFNLLVKNKTPPNYKDEKKENRPVKEKEQQQPQQKISTTTNELPPERHSTPFDQKMDAVVDSDVKQPQQQQELNENDIKGFKFRIQMPSIYIKNDQAFDPNIMDNIDGNKATFEHYQKILKEKWEELYQVNKVLQMDNSKKFAEEVDRVEKQYFRNYEHLMETPCKDLESKVIRCYQVNKNKPLICTDVVKNFATCIEENRMKLLKHQ